MCDHTFSFVTLMEHMLSAVRYLRLSELPFCTILSRVFACSCCLVMNPVMAIPTLELSTSCTL